MIIKKYYKILFIVAALGASGLLYLSYHMRQHPSGVRATQFHIDNFNELRDTAFVLDLFKENWYWLVSEYSVNFSPEFVLQTGLSSQNPALAHPATLKVAYQGDTPVGFLAYYMKKFYLGIVWFIVLKPEFRGKGYAYQMMDYAVKDLVAQGASKIQLVTRTNNFAAQKLYTRYGFHEVGRDDGFVDFEFIA